MRGIFILSTNIIRHNSMPHTVVTVMQVKLFSVITFFPIVTRPRMNFFFQKWFLFSHSEGQPRCTVFIVFVLIGLKTSLESSVSRLCGCMKKSSVMDSLGDCLSASGLSAAPVPNLSPVDWSVTFLLTLWGTLACHWLSLYLRSPHLEPGFLLMLETDASEIAQC